MKMERRRGLAAAAAVLIVVLMVLALSGCGAEEAGEEEPQTGVPNPWSDVETPEEAADGAGVELFSCAGIETSLGTTEPEGYRWMEGLAEAKFPIAAVDMTVRKGTDEVADVAEGDISGDYNEYKYTWTQDVGGVVVTCSGNRKGESTKTIWSKGGYNYSVTAYGAGGDDDFGLSKKDVAAMVNGVR